MTRSGEAGRNLRVMRGDGGGSGAGGHGGGH
jgi:hypothetical protein